MGEHILTILVDFFQKYGYWTILGGLLLENAGIPVPGETILLYGSFLASSKHTLKLPYIVIVAIIAAVCGDNIGYAIGRFGGRPLLDRYKQLFRISDETIRKVEALIAKHGAKTIFTARFIAGLRVIAGPLAGVLRMHWSRFMTFNFLGGVAWVMTIATVGYVFGNRLAWVLRVMGKVNLAILVIVFIAAGIWFLHRQRRVRKPESTPPHAPAGAE